MVLSHVDDYLQTTNDAPPQSLDGFTFDLQRFDDVDSWDGETITTSTINGNSITINSAAELAGLAQQVNNGNTYSNYTITLGVDINLQYNLWTPIGNYSNQFKGIFDGGGYTISGLTVNITDGNH